MVCGGVLSCVLVSCDVFCGVGLCGDVLFDFFVMLSRVMFVVVWCCLM